MSYPRTFFEILIFDGVISHSCMVFIMTTIIPFACHVKNSYQIIDLIVLCICSLMSSCIGLHHRYRLYKDNYYTKIYNYIGMYTLISSFLMGPTLRLLMNKNKIQYNQDLYVVFTASNLTIYSLFVFMFLLFCIKKLMCVKHEDQQPLIISHQQPQTQSFV